MKGISIFLLALLILVPSPVYGQEIRVGSEGVVKSTVSVLVQNGISVSNKTGKTFRPNADQCQMQKGGKISIGHALFEMPDTFIVHYVITDEGTEDDACPERTIFFATLSQLRSMPIEWGKQKGPAF